MSVQNVWKWLVGVALLALAVVVFLALRARGKKSEANAALADGIDAITKPALARREAELAKLNAAAVKDASAVAAAQLAVEASKQKLTERYKALELTPEQIAERFRNLSV